MTLGRHFAEFTGLDITDLISTVVETFADKTASGLEESQHAPKKDSRNSQSLGQHFSHQTLGGDKEKITHHHSFPPAVSSPASPLSHSAHHNTSKQNTFDQPSNTNKSANMGQFADVDDTAAFMAAARSFKLEKEYGKPPASSDDAVSDEEPNQTLDTGDEFAAPADTGFGGFEVTGPEPDTSGSFGGYEVNEPASSSPDKIATSFQSLTVDAPVFTPRTEYVASDLGSTGDKLTSANLHAFVASTETKVEVDEDRENLKTFKSWGAPVVRARPAAQIRRCIIKGLPPTWATPDKVLSMVHGGLIESVSITPTGNAHILFYDADACRAFYDKYPNGLDLDRERKFTAFIDLGEEVDVISSQLSFNLSVGSTRVVRAVGVDMEVTMSEIVKIATASNREVEKIIDNYVPGCPRSVSFRFCSIEDAVRFRAALVRNEEWEHCNVQYATDPCEVATGYHAD
ncbi:uncharacterized protein BDV14DRAFT_200735 [Aspergillus stella-maris]|uniref:uncharacterized protein n=1 Tax=Aspergillus stella-maris TaxID=1810926 RepID=UPI003CCDE772